MLGHSIPYIATASVAYPDDVIEKFSKARKINGTRFIHLLSPCPPGWRIDSAKSIQVTRMATQARVFPIFEIANGKYKINVQPERSISVEEYLKTQGRFRQMPPEMISAAQESADRKWEELVKLAHNVWEMTLKSELEAYRRDKGWYAGGEASEMIHAGP